MKVILAGYPKTGTKTMNEAFSLLGYKTYDFFEHWWFHGKEWIKILRNGATTDYFYQMYKDVDAVVDAPAFYFWEEIHEAFPDAKIILTLRDEDSWQKSYDKQSTSNNTVGTSTIAFVAAVSRLNPFAIIKFLQFSELICRVQFGSKLFQQGANRLVDSMQLRRHNTYVMQTAPKDKLLVYKVSEGWEPLCQFLGKDVPDVPFPHKNKGAATASEVAAEHPIAVENLRIAKKRFLVFMLFFSVGFVIFLSWIL